MSYIKFLLILLMLSPVCFALELDSSNQANQLQNYARSILRPSGELFPPYMIGDKKFGISFFNNELPNAFKIYSEEAYTKYKKGKNEYLIGSLVVIGSVATFFASNYRIKNIDSERRYEFSGNTYTLLIPLGGYLMGTYLAFQGGNSIAKSMEIYNHAVDKKFGLR